MTDTRRSVRDVNAACKVWVTALRLVQTDRSECFIRFLISGVW
jgi:hypothetical protein